MARASLLRIIGLEDIGPHYATTLARWRANLLRNADRERALGYPDTFLRMWEFYYCEGGIAEGARRCADQADTLARLTPRLSLRSRRAWADRQLRRGRARPTSAARARAATPIKIGRDEYWQKFVDQVSRFGP